MIKPASLDRWPRGIAYKNGFRILGTPLGFGNAIGCLRFLTNLESHNPRKGERLLSSRILAQAFSDKRRNIDILALSQGQTIRLGQMTLRIYPAGLGPGSAQLEVAIKDRKILYSEGVRLAKPLFCRAAEVPRADLLLLDAPPAQPKPPAPANVSKALKKWIKQCLADDINPILVFGNRAAAFDAVHTTREMGLRLRVQRRLFDMIRRASMELPLADAIQRLDQRIKPGEGAIISALDWPRSRFFSASNKKTAYIGPGREIPVWADRSFRMGECEDRPGMLTYIKHTGVTQVALGDGADESLTAALTEMGIEAFRLTHPTQIPLPFTI